jgi:hypothetical protein
LSFIMPGYQCSNVARSELSRVFAEAVAHAHHLARFNGGPVIYTYDESG